MMHGAGDATTDPLSKLLQSLPDAAPTLEQSLDQSHHIVSFVPFGKQAYAYQIVLPNKWFVENKLAEGSHQFPEWALIGLFARDVKEDAPFVTVTLTHLSFAVNLEDWVLFFCRSDHWNVLQTRWWRTPAGLVLDAVAVKHRDGAAGSQPQDVMRLMAYPDGKRVFMVAGVARLADWDEVKEDLLVACSTFQLERPSPPDVPLYEKLILWSSGEEDDGPRFSMQYPETWTLSLQADVPRGKSAVELQLLHQSGTGTQQLLAYLLVKAVDCDQHPGADRLDVLLSEAIVELRASTLQEITQAGFVAAPQTRFQQPQHTPPGQHPDPHTRSGAPAGLEVSASSASDSGAPGHSGGPPDVQGAHGALDRHGGGGGGGGLGKPSSKTGLPADWEALDSSVDLLAGLVPGYLGTAFLKGTIAHKAVEVCAGFIKQDKTVFTLYLVSVPLETDEALWMRGRAAFELVRAHLSTPATPPGAQASAGHQEPWGPVQEIQQGTWRVAAGAGWEALGLGKVGSTLSAGDLCGQAGAGLASMGREEVVLASPVPARAQSSEYPPHQPWQQDDQTQCCMLCSGVFGTFRRRHHCRACGLVVCASCSPSKVMLPEEYKLDVLMRVCNVCNALLSADAKPTCLLYKDAASHGKLRFSGDIFAHTWARFMPRSEVTMLVQRTGHQPMLKRMSLVSFGQSVAPVGVQQYELCVSTSPCGTPKPDQRKALREMRIAKECCVNDACSLMAVPPLARTIVRAAEKLILNRKTMQVYRYEYTLPDFPTCLSLSIGEQRLRALLAVAVDKTPANLVRVRAWHSRDPDPFFPLRYEVEDPARRVKLVEEAQQLSESHTPQTVGQQSSARPINCTRFCGTLTMHDPKVGKDIVVEYTVLRSLSVPGGVAIFSQTERGSTSTYTEHICGFVANQRPVPANGA